MRVDIADVAGCKIGIRQRQAHGARGPGRIGGHDVARIGAHAKARDPGQDLRAARPGVVFRLEHQNARAVADHQAPAAQAERAAGVGGQHAQTFPRLDPAKAQHRLGAPGQHDVGRPAAHQQERQPHRVVGTGAGRSDGQHRPRRPVPDRQMRGCRIVHQSRHGQGRDAGSPFCKDRAIAVLPGLDAAGRRAQDHARAG